MRLWVRNNTSLRSLRSSEAPGASSRNTPPKWRMRTARSWETLASSVPFFPQSSALKKIERMGEPQPRRFGAIGGHAKPSFCFDVQTVEQVRVHPDTNRDREVSGGGAAGEILILHAADGNLTTLK